MPQTKKHTPRPKRTFEVIFTGENLNALEDVAEAIAKIHLRRLREQTAAVLRPSRPHPHPLPFSREREPVCAFFRLI